MKKSEAILKLIAEFGNPEGEDVDLCDHVFWDKLLNFQIDEIGMLPPFYLKSGKKISMDGKTFDKYYLWEKEYANDR